MLPDHLNLLVAIWKEEDGYVVESPDFGIVSQGDTEREALENIKEALELYLEDEDVQNSLGYINLPEITISFIPSEKEIGKGLGAYDELTHPLR